MKPNVFARCALLALAACSKNSDGAGDTDTLEMKKESDKVLNVKKIENGKTVKTYKYEKIR